MLFRGLHAFGRDSPNGLVQIKLAPARADHLARAGGGEDCKLHRQCGDGFPRPQRLNKRWHLLISHGPMMAPRKARAGRENLRKVPAPARRVFASPEPVCLGVIEYGFDPAAHPAGCLGFAFPDRLQNPEHVRRINLGHRQLTDHGMNIGVQCIAPLLPVLGIAPAFLIGRDIGVRNLAKCRSRHLCRLSGCKSLSRFPVAFLQRINASLHLEAKRRRFVACIGKRHSALASRANPNVARLAVQHEAVNP